MLQHQVKLPSPATLAAAVQALRTAEPGEQVLLILPDEADELAHSVRLQSLRRQADALQVQVGLLTNDPDIRYHARHARIPTFRNLQQAGRRWRYPSPLPPLPSPASVRPTRLSPPPDSGLDTRAPEIITLPHKTILVGETRRRKRHWLVVALSYLLLLAVLGGLAAGAAVLLIPQATVTLVPARTSFVISEDITARVGIEEPTYLARRVPARPVQTRVEGFDTIATTGLEEAALGKATGTVRFINRTAREIPVPANTIVRTTTGNNVRFRVTEAITVTSGLGQSATALIEAVEPGRKGNVPALTINEIEGPLNLQLRVSNERPTAGGTVEPVPVVTAGDKERLLGKLQAELQKQAYARLGESLQQGEIIPPETVRTFTLAETYDHFAGEPAEMLGLQLQLLARGLAVDVADAQAMAERSLRESIPPDHFLLEETIQISDPTFVRFSDEAVDMTFTASAQALIPIKISDVRALLRGVPLADAPALLQEQFDLDQPPLVELNPNWLDSLPLIGTRIRVRVLQQAP